MLYLLKCGKCFQDNNVAASLEPIEWLCNNCVNDNSSSLPRQADKTMVIDYTKAKSILSPTDAGKATNIVQSSPLTVVQPPPVTVVVTNGKTG